MSDGPEGLAALVKQHKALDADVLSYIEVRLFSYLIDFQSLRLICTTVSIFIATMKNKYHPIQIGF